MKYFMGIVLCISTVCAEAIPLVSVEYFQLPEYTAFVEVVKASQGNPLSKNDDSAMTIPPANSENVEDRSPVTGAKLPQSKLEPPKPTDTLPDQKPDEVKPPIVSVSSPPSKQTESSMASPVLSLDVVAAQDRAKKLYGNEAGYVGATDRVVTAQNGQRFLYLNIRGDGNCGFYASGVDRHVFVQTIEDLINAQHDVYQAFVDERDALGRAIAKIKLADDKVTIADRVNRLATQADNGASLVLTLKRLVDYEAEKAKYRAELFQDWLRALIARLQELTDISAIQRNSGLIDRINTLINELVSANYDYAAIQKLIEDNGNEIIVELQRMNIASERFQRDMKGILDILNNSDEQLFEKFKLRLMNQIQNLTMDAGYEAFLTALRAELVASNVTANLDSKENVIDAVKKIFSMNRGSEAWFPGGLFGALKDILGVEYNIWARGDDGFIRLYSGSEGNGSPAKGAKVRHMFFTGGHYDMLIPIED